MGSSPPPPPPFEAFSPKGPKSPRARRARACGATSPALLQRVHPGAHCVARPACETPHATPAGGLAFGSKTGPPTGRPLPPRGTPRRRPHHASVRAQRPVGGGAWVGPRYVLEPTVYPAHTGVFKNGSTPLETRGGGAGLAARGVPPDQRSFGACPVPVDSRRHVGKSCPGGPAPALPRTPANYFPDPFQLVEPFFGNCQGKCVCGLA
jgi:hypothetical protein